MPPKTPKEISSVRSLFRLSLCLLTTVGSFSLIITQPALAQRSDNSRSNATQPPTTPDQIFYEVKGSELKACRKLAKPTKDKDKECVEAGRGYTTILRTANSLYSDGNISDAETLYRKLIERYPKEAEAYYKLGSLLLSQQKNSDAIDLLKKAISLNADHAKAHNDLGIAFANNGEMDGAIAEWRAAVKINPDFPDALTNLGLGLLQPGQNKKDEAIANLKKAKELFIKQGRNQQADRVDQVLQEVSKESSKS
jgi:tetratricopeptide (TPR) repeat protein